MAWELFLQAATHHPFDDLFSGEVCNGSCTHIPAIAQYGKAVGNLLNLFQEMADVHDGHAFVAQAPNQVEKALSVGLRERTCRLVENQDSHIDQEGPCNFDKLTGCRTECRDGTIGMNFGMLKDRERVFDALAIGMSPK